MTATLEQQFKPHLRGIPVTRTDSHEINAWAGRGTVNSGSTTATVSTSLVHSDSLIFISPMVGSMDPVTTNSGGFLSTNVNSVIDGVSFGVGWASGTAVSQDVEFSWMIWRVR